MAPSDAHCIKERTRCLKARCTDGGNAVAAHLHRSPRGRTSAVITLAAPTSGKRRQRTNVAIKSTLGFRLHITDGAAGSAVARNPAFGPCNSDQ